LERFERYAQLLVEWNERVNLTAILDPYDIAVKHFLDSVSVLQACSIANGATVIDVGTGAGFPGLPIKIVRPDISLTLVDSLQKRIHFLKTLTEELHLSGVNIFHGRAEEVGQSTTFRENYDRAVSRAVAPLNILVEFCLPLVKPGGFFVALKGPDLEDELRNAQSAIATLGGIVKNTVSFNLPISGDPRCMVIIEKKSSTPAKYPRRPGMPEKKPL
jgi:16S rRNA (guanine527-N7)-methyltransferase